MSLLDQLTWEIWASEDVGVVSVLKHYPTDTWDNSSVSYTNLCCFSPSNLLCTRCQALTHDQKHTFSQRLLMSVSRDLVLKVCQFCSCMNKGTGIKINYCSLRLSHTVHLAVHRPCRMNGKWCSHSAYPTVANLSVRRYSHEGQF